MLTSLLLKLQTLLNNLKKNADLSRWNPDSPQFLRTARHRPCWKYNNNNNNNCPVSMLEIRISFNKILLNSCPVEKVYRLCKSVGQKNNIPAKQKQLIAGIQNLLLQKSEKSNLSKCWPMKSNWDDDWWWWWRFSPFHDNK